MPVVTLFILAVMLMLGGAGALLVGTDSVVPDRPLAAAIGGTIALCTGAILIGLALTVRELTAIRRTLQLTDEPFADAEEPVGLPDMVSGRSANAGHAVDTAGSGIPAPDGAAGVPAPAVQPLPGRPATNLAATGVGLASAAGGRLAGAGVAGAGALAAVAAAVSVGVADCPAVSDATEKPQGETVQPGSQSKVDAVPSPDMADDLPPAVNSPLSATEDADPRFEKASDPSDGAASESIAEEQAEVLAAPAKPFDLEREFDLMLQDVAGAPSAAAAKQDNELSRDIAAMWEEPAVAAVAGPSSASDLSEEDRTELAALIESAVEESEPIKAGSADADIAHVEEITRDIAAIPPVPSLNAMRESIVQDLSLERSPSGESVEILPETPSVEEGTGLSKRDQPDRPSDPPQTLTESAIKEPLPASAPEPESAESLKPVTPGFQWRRSTGSVWQKNTEEAPEPVPETPIASEAVVSIDEKPVVPELAQPEKTMIRTFSSGPNQYTMFSDGSIAADTPSGRFEFASFNELRDFIDNYKS